MRTSAMCIDRLHWLSVKNFVARDPNPGDPDVHPVREPEPEPDTPEPEPGDEPRRIDPVRARGVTDLAIVIA